MPVNTNSSSNGCTCPLIVTEIAFAVMLVSTSPEIWFDCVANPSSVNCLKTLISLVNPAPTLIGPLNTPSV